MSDRLVLIPEDVLADTVDRLAHNQPVSVLLLDQLAGALDPQAQQQLAERAWERFDAAYGRAYASNDLRRGDATDQAQAHAESLREAFEAMLDTPDETHAPDRDDGQPITEGELMLGYGLATFADEIRRRRVPHALRRDLGV